MNLQTPSRFEPSAELRQSGLVAGYMSGFGNSFETEALAGALPVGRNSPQKVNYGLYAEQLSGSPFTAPHESNQRSWLYRIRPTVKHSSRYRKIDKGLIRTAPAAREESDLPIGQLRWGPIPIPDENLTFVSGLRTITTAGDAETRAGMAAHVLLVTASMRNEYVFNADGEFLIVAQQGKLRLRTEFGVIEIEPGEICVIQRGMIFKVELVDGPARAYVCENYGGAFTLPYRGPIGANCLANARDFLTPVAAYEDKEEPSTLFVKWGGELYATEISQSPLDVVAWHGNYAPYKYDLRRFSPVGALLFDHPDPSIYSVMTAPSETPGTANVDLIIFPERWQVAENTFRPPWYHRNLMSEFMGLIYGVYDAKPEGFVPGGISLHNCMLPHGPDEQAFEHASNSEIKPVKLTNTMAFMFETRFPQRVTKYAAGLKELQRRLHRLLAGPAQTLRSGQQAAMIDDTHKPGRRSWVASANDHADFPIQNLPLGVFTPPSGAARGGVAIGDEILDLAAALELGLFDGAAAKAAQAAAGATLNPLFALGREARVALRQRVGEILDADGRDRARIEGLRSRILHRAEDCRLGLPAAIGDYTDFFAGIHHATNAGKLFRPDNPLLPNYKYVPIGYHGRASSISASGAPVRRPERPAQAGERDGPELRAQPQPRLRAGARRLDRPGQRARRADRDRAGRAAHRRLLSAQRLVGARRAGLGGSAARPVPRQEFLDHGLAVGGHAGGAGAVPDRAGAAAGGGSGAASLSARRRRTRPAARSTSGSRCFLPRRGCRRRGFPRTACPPATPATSIGRSRSSSPTTAATAATCGPAICSAPAPSPRRRTTGSAACWRFPPAVSGR